MVAMAWAKGRGGVFTSENGMEMMEGGRDWIGLVVAAVICESSHLA